MKKKITLLAALLSFLLFAACSSPEDISAWEASDVLTKVREAIMVLSEQEAIHTIEKVVMTYPEGADTVNMERWYAGGNCLYIGEQENGMATTYLQYNGENFLKVSANDEWMQAKQPSDLAPVGAKQEAAQQLSEENMLSWETVDGEYHVTFHGFPEETDGKQVYKENRETYCFNTRWELLRVENHAEFSMESWADGSMNDTITDMTVEYQNTSAKRVKNKIEDAYKEATEK